MQNIELNPLLVHDDRYIKTKIRTYGEKVYTNFRLLMGMGIFYNHFYLVITCLWKQILPASILDNCAYKIADRQITDYLDDNLFKSWWRLLFWFW